MRGSEARDLLHLDIKKLGRIARPSHWITGNRRDRAAGVGWEYLHVAIDDHSRIAFSAIYPDEKRSSALALLAAALDYYARFGIRFQAVLTDNGLAYRSCAFAQACRALGLKHRFTRPYTPRTNGKAERFIQTSSAGMGLCPHLSALQRTQTAASPLAAPVQLASTPC